MLPRAARMRSAAEFRATTRTGRRVPRPSCVIHLVVDPSSDGCRVGLVTSKAIGGSVERHRAARRMRAALRPLIPLLPPGSRLVVRALPGADRAGDLAVQIDSAVRQALASNPSVDPRG